MSDEHLASIIQSAIWAAAFVLSVSTILPTLRFWVQRSCAGKEREFKPGERKEPRRDGDDRIR